MESSGPSSINPKTNRVFGMNFPVITIGDMVRAQEKLVQTLGINKLFAVIGGSMGGMQALEWAVSFHKVDSVVLLQLHRHSAQNIVFHEIGRQAIMADGLVNGNYYK